MRLFPSLLLSALLLFASADGFAAKRLSNRGYSYFPAFSVGSTSSVSYTSTAGKSFTMDNADGNATTLVRILTTTASYIAIGTDPSPTSADIPLPANTEMIIEIPNHYKVGASMQSSTGFLYATHLKMNPSD